MVAERLLDAGKGWIGDLVVNIDRAVQVDPDHEGIDYELALYNAHCFDHLLGGEDDTDEKRKAMHATETAWRHHGQKQWLDRRTV